MDLNRGSTFILCDVRCVVTGTSPVCSTTSHRWRYPDPPDYCPAQHPAHLAHHQIHPACQVHVIQLMLQPRGQASLSPKGVQWYTWAHTFACVNCVFITSPACASSPVPPQHPLTTVRFTGLQLGTSGAGSGLFCTTMTTACTIWIHGASLITVWEFSHLLFE